MATKLKTRSTLFLRQMSDDVKVKLVHISKETGIAQWLIVEQILESAFRISNNNVVNVTDYLADKSRAARTGKAQRK